MAKLYLTKTYQHILDFLSTHPESSESQIAQYLWDKTSLEYLLIDYLKDLEMLEKIECDVWEEKWSSIYLQFPYNP
jgi:hypothetical protein